MYNSSVEPQVIQWYFELKDVKEQTRRKIWTKKHETVYVVKNVQPAIS